MNRINHKQSRRPLSEINVVPYIDVMLVLLVIFMATTPLLNEGVKVELPHAKARVINKQEEEPIIVSVDDKGRYYLNINNKPSQPVSPVVLLNKLTAELRFARQGKHERPVFIKGDHHVDYGRVVKAMVLLQQAGVSRVGLMTQSIEKNERSYARKK